MLFSKSILASALAASAVAQMSLLDLLTSNNKTLGTLTGLLQNQPALTTNLTNARNITILAPSNDAFTKFLSTPAGQAASNDPGMLVALLQYHVLVGAHPSSGLNTSIYAPSMLTNTTYTNVTNGQVVQLSTMGNKVMALSGNKEMSMSTTMDVMFTGGVIHVIDKVLTIPMTPSRAALDSGLTGLAGALNSTNLISAVDTSQDLTIFAPSNAAFERIGSALPALQANQTMFQDILTYHLVKGTVAYAGRLGNMSLITAEGEMVKVEVVGKKVFVNSAQVIISDVLVANGVVHVIDSVLNPANSTATPNPTATSQAVAFTGVTSSSAIPFTSGITPTTTAPSASTSTAAAGRVEGAVGLAALFGVVAIGVL